MSDFERREDEINNTYHSPSNANENYINEKTDNEQNRESNLKNYNNSNKDSHVEEKQDILSYQPRVYSSDENNQTKFNSNNNQYQNSYYTEVIKKDNKKPKSNKLRQVAWITILAIIFGVVSQFTNVYTKPFINKYVNPKGEPFSFSSQSKLNKDDNTSSVGERKLSSKSNLSVSDVADLVKPSVVTITTKTQVQDFFFNGTYEKEGGGSGIIFGEKNNEYLIVTNYHVISNMSGSKNSKIQIQFFNKQANAKKTNDNSMIDATVKGFDSDADLAVLTVDKSSIEKDTLSQIKPAKFGDSDSIRVGELAIAIGSPLGMSHTVTGGYISAVNRVVEGMRDKNIKLIQTDAAINPGNSGGALVNAQGEVIGINVIKYSSTEVEGMGFAIPINEAKTILEDIANEKPKPFLGIGGKDITEELSEVYEIPLGIYVQGVEPNGPANKAGIQQGDIIIAINGTKTFKMEELQKQLRKYQPGNTIKMKIIRYEGNKPKTMEVKVKLANKNDYINQ